MKTVSEIRAEGMTALVAALGAVDAQRFIAALSRERFDYTEMATQAASANERG